MLPSLRRHFPHIIWQVAALVLLALIIFRSQTQAAQYAAQQFERGNNSISVYLPIIHSPALPSVYSITQLSPNFVEVTDIASIGDGRLFFAEKDGWIKVRQPNGSVSTFLDISDRVSHSGERGVLGLAFDSDYGNNGYFYVAYTGYDSSGNTRSLVSRFSVSAEANVALSTSEVKLLNIQNESRVHNGGALRVHPLNGGLYTGIGDDERSEKSQSNSDFRGKLIRVDTTGLQLHTIVAKGFRNPWRLAIDGLTGDFYVGDVGASRYEEIDHIPFQSIGLNFGWPCMEGYHIVNLGGGCDGQDQNSWIRPIHAYNHGTTPGTGCAITLGLALRHPGYAEPRILFGDYCLGDIRLLTKSNGVWTMSILGTLPDDNLETTVFAPDGSGNIIVGTRNGAIYQLSVPDG